MKFPARLGKGKPGIALKNIEGFKKRYIMKFPAQPGKDVSWGFQKSEPGIKKTYCT